MRIAACAYTDPVVVGLVEAVQREYVVRYGGPDDAVVDAAEFAPPQGLFLVGHLTGEPPGAHPPDGAGVATGGWRLVPDAPVRTAEIKRMFVVREARRRGLGREMLAALEQTALDAGVGELVLNTGLAQPEAIAMYEAGGYTPAPAFGHYADAPQALFYRKRLSRAGSPAGATPG